MLETSPFHLKYDSELLANLFLDSSLKLPTIDSIAMVVSYLDVDPLESDTS